MQAGYKSNVGLIEVLEGFGFRVLEFSVGCQNRSRYVEVLEGPIRSLTSVLGIDLG